jgi:hypothetical protein
MNDELETIWKEAVVAKCKVPSQHLNIGTEENHEEPQDSLSQERDLNSGHPEYEACVLTTRPRVR